jgi:hypothetical protein
MFSGVDRSRKKVLEPIDKGGPVGKIPPPQLGEKTKMVANTRVIGTVQLKLFDK